MHFDVDLQQNFNRINKASLTVSPSLPVRKGNILYFCHSVVIPLHMRTCLVV